MEILLVYFGEASRAGSCVFFLRYDVARPSLAHDTPITFAELKTTYDCASRVPMTPHRSIKRTTGCMDAYVGLPVRDRINLSVLRSPTPQQSRIASFRILPRRWLAGTR